MFLCQLAEINENGGKLFVSCIGNYLKMPSFQLLFPSILYRKSSLLVNLTFRCIFAVCFWNSRANIIIKGI